MYSKLNNLLLFFLCQTILCFGTSHKYYVSGAGNNNNSGSFESPFQTIQKAASIMVPGDTCLIRAGIYRETIKPNQSGVSGNLIVFMPFGCEKVIVSGADLLANSWANYKENIYKTYMPWTMGLGKDQIFVDGNLEIQARHPNVRNKAMAMPPVTEPLSPLWPMAFGRFQVTMGSNTITNPNDLNQDLKDYWKGALYLGFHKWSWCMQTADVTGSSKGQITYDNRTKTWWFPDDADAPDYRFMFDSIQDGYLTNHIHALDQAGEWHWQKDTLYLWTNTSANPSNLKVEAKKRQLAFDLRNLNFIEIKNIDVFCAAVNLYNSNNCTINGCRLSYISHFQKWDSARDGLIDGPTATLTSALYKGEVGIIIGGTGNTIKNSIVEYSSGAGLYLNGNNTTITNCIVHDCGYTSTYLGCIYIFNNMLSPTIVTGGHVITHCDLYNAGRAVISVFGNQTQTSFDALEISYNRIHDGCILGNDGGLFNSWSVNLGSANKKTQIHHNLIWDQWGQFWAGLVYPDNNTYFMEAHHNVLWYSAKNVYDLKGRLFWKANLPNDCTYHDNKEKNNYSNGVNGLTAADYPGGYFETGASFKVSSSDCGLATASVSCEMRQNELKVYPNPANSWADVIYSMNKTGSPCISVWNLSGEELFGTLLGNQETGLHQTRLDIKRLNNGIYWVKLNLWNELITQKLIVCR